MKTIFALPLIALGLAACQAYPTNPYRAGPYPTIAPQGGGYRAIGTEPFWDLTFGRDLVFTDRGSNVRVAEPMPPVRREIKGETYFGRRLAVTIVHGRCSDGMSDRTYPDSVTVSVDGRIYNGCGANDAYFARVGEDGGDRGDLTALIAGRWVAASIDGRPARPDERFALVLTPTQVRTEGVCNDLRGHYRIAAGKLSPEGSPWPRTERGCDPRLMALEDRVYAVMWHQPVVSFPAPDRLRLTSNRGSIEFARAR